MSSSLFLFHSERGTTDNLSTAGLPSGWAVLQRSTQSDGAGGQMDIASGPASGRSYTFDGGTSLGLTTEGVMVEMSNIDPAGTPTTYSASESGGAGTTPSITCVVPGSGVLIAGIRISSFDSGARTLTPPPGFTTVYQRVNTGGPGERDWGVVSVVYKNVSAGTHTLAWTMSNTYSDWGKAMSAVFVPTFPGASSLLQYAASGESSGGYTITLPHDPAPPATPPTPNGSLQLDVYSINPPGDSITWLATLSGAFDRFIRPERNAVGSGGFKIRRDDPGATDAILAQGNLVKVTVPQIDPDPIFSFFIQDKTPVVVSADESGGEILQVAGRGALDYFDWARWLAVSYVVPWWDAGWADLVAGKPPAGSLGHIAVASGTHNRFTFDSSGKVNYPPTTFTTGGFSAFYDRRQVRVYASGPLAGKKVTLVRLSTGSHAGWWLHPMDAGYTDVRASSVLGLRPEFGDIGASSVTQWWDSAWGTPPAGTVGRVSLAAGTYHEYTVSGSTITGHSTFTTGGMSAWYDSRVQYRNGKTRTTLVHLSSGGMSGHYLYPAEKGIRDWQASEPVVSLVPGKVLYRICQEVQAADRPSHPMPLLTYDFTETEDSSGNQWTTTDSLAGITADVGDPMLDSLSKILATGVVDFEMGPDLDFHAWNERGRDLTGTSFAAGVVRFAKSVNIATELQRESIDGPVPTYTQVVGNDGWGSAQLPDASSRVARETTTRVETDDESALDAAGLADLERRLERSDAAGFQVRLGNDEASGLYLPGPPGSANGKYWLGDLVSVHTGTGADDFDEEVMRVAAITLTETESGDLVAIPEVGSSLGAAEDAAFPGSSGDGGGSGSGGTTSGTTVTTTTESDLSAYQALAEKGVASGYAALDGSALVPVSELPDVEALATAETDTTKVLKPDGAGGLAFGVVPTTGFELNIEGGQSVVKAHGLMGATETFDPADGNVHTGTLDASCTFTLAAPAGSGACTLELRLAQDGTGGHAITWPGSVTLVGTLDTTAGTTSAVVVETLDGGTTWTAWVVGGGAAFATPSIALGTAASAGSAGTTIRSDATIAAFDATAPTTQALGDAAATGSAAYAARRDHKHAMPALSTATPLVESGSGSAGSSSTPSREDHVHPAAAAAAALRPVMVADTDGTHWNVLVDGSGNAIMTT